jgi:RND superfamily putative drug exporter
LVQVYLRGNQGTALANQSVDAIRKIVADTCAPGVKAYVTGAAPLITDNFEVGSHHKVTGITFLVIAVMLLFVYRSITTMLIMLVTVAVELAAARGTVAVLAHSGLIGLSTYSTNLLLLAIAAGTDYAIFIVGRYHEARLKAGTKRRLPRHVSWNRARHHRIRLTIAGAVAPILHPVAVLPDPGHPGRHRCSGDAGGGAHDGSGRALIASRFGLFEPKRAVSARGWRRVGTAIVRWPGPILVVSLGITLVGLLALPGQGQLRRPAVPAEDGAVRDRIHRGRTTLLRGPTQSGTAHARVGSRHAQPCRHAHPRTRCQGRAAHTWHRAGAVDHPAAGHRSATVPFRSR